MPITPIRPSGTINQLLANDGNGGLSNVNVGTNLTYDTNTKTLSASGGGGGGGLTSFNGRTAPAAMPTSGDYTGLQVTNTPAGNVASTTVQGAINELDQEKTSWQEAFYDCVLDGVGTAPNHYVNVKAAHDAGKSIMKNIVATVDATSFTLARSLVIHNIIGAEVTFNSDMQITLGASGEYGVTFSQDDPASIATINYVQTGNDKPLFIGGNGLCSINYPNCGMNWAGVTGARSSICESAIMNANGAVIYAGNADSSGFSPSEFGCSSEGAKIIAGGTNSANIYVNKGCSISNIYISKGTSTETELFKHTSSLSITNGIIVDAITNDATAEIRGNIANLSLASGDLSFVNASGNTRYDNISVNANSSWTSLGNCADVVLNSYDTDGSIITDPTDSGFFYNDCKISGTFIDAGSNTKVSNCVYEDQAAFQGPSAQLSNSSFDELVNNSANALITGCEAAIYSGTEKASATAAGNNSIIGNSGAAITGTITTSWQGPYATPVSGDVKYSLNSGGIVSLRLPAVSGSATTGGQPITATAALPLTLWPLSNQSFPILATDSSTQVIGNIVISNSGSLTIRPSASTSGGFSGGSLVAGFPSTTINFYKV